MPSNNSQYAYNDQVFYDGLGRVIQTRSIWSDVAENNHRENETFTLTQYDALGRVVCQTTPFREEYFTNRAAWPANPVLQNVACANRPHTTTSYDSFSQPVAVTQPNNQMSQTLYGLRASYGINELQQWAGQYSDVAGRLAGVDESNRPEGALEDNFANSNHLNSNWPIYSVGSSGSRTIVNGELDIHHTGSNGTQYGVSRPVAIPNSNDDEGISFKFKVSQPNGGLTWLSLENGTWNSSSYRLWGLLVEGGQIKLQEWEGAAETKTNLMPIQANQWYQVVLKVSKNSSRTFSLVVWAENNPANMAEIQRSKASNWVMQDWKFTAKTNLSGNHLWLDNYVEREFYRTAYGYDGQGNLNLVSKTNSSGGNVQTTMTYNQFGQKISMVDPDMGSWSYGYDPAGNLTHQTNSSNQTLCFYYDQLSRLTFKAELNSGASCPTDSTSSLLTSLASYTYSTAGSSAGKLTSVTWRRDSSSDGETFGYDDRGRLTNHTRTLLGRTYTMEYGAFDVFNRPGTIKYSSNNNLTGTILTPSYDKEGENGLKEGSSWLVSDVQYNVQGQMTYFNRSSASAKDSTFAYADQMGNFRLNGIQHGSLTDEVPDYSYSYDPAGNITQITEQLQQSGVNRSLVQTFGYDKLSRLLTAQSLGNSNLGVLSYNHVYRYDKLGNMTQWQNNGVLTTYGYTSGRPHAVSSTSGGVNATFSYDPQGNMSGRSQNGVSYVQGFDKENRLISVTTNGQTTHFKYDANGQRTMTLAPSGLYTFYPFPNVEEEVNLNNQDYTLKYTYSSAGVAVAVRTKAKQGTTTTNTLHYLYSDHLGSTSTVTNASGGQVQQTRFLPFGGYWGTPTQTVTDRGYTGHLHNDEVGLIYMNARFYVPSIGRFASADTIVPNPTNPQAFNRYSYVENNPLIFTDSTGHYGEGVHYNLTSEMVYLATELIVSYINIKFPNPYGPESPEGVGRDLAFVIATNNQFTDTHEDTMPHAVHNLLPRVIHDFGSTAFMEPTNYYHFESRIAAENRLQWAIDNNDLKAFGRAMHLYQDTFSHVNAGYTFYHGFQGVLELYLDCFDCATEGGFDGALKGLRAFTNLGHVPFSAYEWIPGYTDKYDENNPRDIAMKNGTFYWSTLMVLKIYGLDPEDYFQTMYNMSPEEWYEQNVGNEY